MKIVFVTKMGVNGAFLDPKSTFLKFSLNLFLDFSVTVHDGRHYKMVKATVWIIKEWDIFGPKNAKIQKFPKIFSLDFFRISSDDRHYKGSKKDCFSFYQGNLN